MRSTKRTLRKFGKELVQSLTEAADHAEGRKKAARVHVIEVPDVKAIHEHLRLSQNEFTRAYDTQKLGAGPPAAAPAAAFLRAIARRPKAIRDALARASIFQKSTLTPIFCKLRKRERGFESNRGERASVHRIGWGI